MRTSEICPRCRLFCIIPPYIFEKMLESKDKATRDAALNSLLLSSQIRGERLATMELGPGVALTTGNARRTIFKFQRTAFSSATRSWPGRRTGRRPMMAPSIGCSMVSA